MRPDRIIVGEVRGGEAMDMLQALNTGHEGSLGTAHANSSRDMLARLEIMTLMAELDLPLQAVQQADCIRGGHFDSFGTYAGPLPKASGNLGGVRL